MKKNLLGALFIVQFTAAQAALKYSTGLRQIDAQFTAAQAALKCRTRYHHSYKLFTAAQAALKSRLRSVMSTVFVHRRLQDVAEEMFDEIYLDSVPEAIRIYIDYEKFARTVIRTAILWNFSAME